MNNRLEKTKDDPFNMKCYRLMKGRKMKEIEFNERRRIDEKTPVL